MSSGADIDTSVPGQKVNKRFNLKIPSEQLKIHKIMSRGLPPTQLKQFKLCLLIDINSVRLLKLISRHFCLSLCYQTSPRILHSSSFIA